MKEIVINVKNVLIIQLRSLVIMNVKEWIKLYLIVKIIMINKSVNYVIKDIIYKIINVLKLIKEIIV